ncbi:SDR family oxidoreductase [Flavisphingomonas formosensis]|uniref:SDR family oxidoreductase n=1 Tax=Flavisphingomonas formosensis TaxID=861534 RepID=UPI0012F7EDA6|nr:SDR family oxidoreductase [Sphingomonas formosensis]
MGKLDGKVALITGGTSGIGLETVRLFAAEGARLAVHGRNADVLAQLSADHGADMLTVRGSIERGEDRQAMLDAVAAHFGGIDILFANAGIFKPVMIPDIDEATFDEMFAVNVKGAFFTVQKALPLLRPGSSVIFNTSAMIHIGVPSSGMYVATKAALRSLVRVLANECAGQGIRFNTVSPGSIITPLHSHSGLEGEAREQVTASIMAATPLRRFGNADEVAKAVLFLASDDSSYVQGEEIVVSGGWSAV